MKKILEKISRWFNASIRGSFYSLPLFINWILGLTWEKDETALRAARRGMILSLAFLFICGLIFTARALFLTFLPQNEYEIYYAALFLHAPFALLYPIFSLYLAIREALGRSQEIGFLDRAAAKFEHFAGF